MKRAFKPTTLGIILVVTFILLAYLSKIFIIPKLGPAWQNDLLWLGGTAVVTVSILAGLAQIIGISLKVLFSGRDSQKFPQIGQENITGNIIVNTGSQGVHNFKGDILQSSSKVVIEQANVVSLQGSKSEESIEKLVRDIKAAL